MSDYSPLATDAAQRRGRGWVLIQIPLLALTITLPAAQHLLALPAPWPNIFVTPTRVVAAVAILVAGVLIRQARSALGAYFVSNPNPPRGAVLRVEGPFRSVRHPVYLGLVLGTTGWALLLTSLAGLVVVAVLSAFLVAKGSHEEGILLRRFPGYAAYRDEVPAFVPRLPIWKRRVP